MIEYRQFINEFSDLDYKKKVINAFASYLDANLDTTYNKTTNKHENETLWWAIGDGNGAYKDKRLTVGTKNTNLTDDSEYKTLVFMVDDDYNLIAYLDAEEYGLLNNTQLQTGAENHLKKYAEWFVSGSKQNAEEVFGQATEVIKKFFADNELSDKTVNDTIAGYNSAEKARLKKQKDASGSYVYIKWNASDEQQLQELKLRRRKLLQARELLQKQMEDLTAVVEDPNSDKLEKAAAKREQKEVADQLVHVDELLKPIRIDIHDLEADKVKYLQYKQATAAQLSAREKDELRIAKLKQLKALGAKNGKAFSNEELFSMTDDAIQKWFTTFNMPTEVPVDTANVKTRKPRAIKTGDVKDSKAAVKANKEKEAKDLMKQKRAAFLARLRGK